MNELRFLEVMGKIDENLLKEADVDIEKQYSSKPSISKRRIYAFGSVAAAAIVVVGSVAVYNSHNSSNLLVEHSIIQQDISGKNDDEPNNKGVPSATDYDNPTEKSTAQTTKSTQNDEEYSSALLQETDLNLPKDNTQTKHSDEETTSENQTSQPLQITTQESKHTDSSAETGASDYYYKKFDATVNPDFDACGKDELPIVSIVISGNYYYQLDSSEHPTHNISPIISDSDFGGYIGNVVELFEYDEPAKYTVSSQEPTLTGADVYYYAPADSPAVIIVKKSEQCSIFLFNGMAAVSDNSSVFAETFRFYGADSADDIENISFSVATPNSDVIEITSQGTITDRDKINSIVDVLYQLNPENNSDSLSATPQWLIDAWDTYKSNPDAYTREDIMLDITFKNGTVLKDISYQPYLGNGYVSGMQELTTEQNATLRSLMG